MRFKEKMGRGVQWNYINSVHVSIWERDPYRAVMEKSENREGGRAGEGRERKLECKVIPHMRYRTIRRVVDRSAESSSPNFPITSRGDGDGNYSSVPLQRHPSKIRDYASTRRRSVSSTYDSPTHGARRHGYSPAACCQNAATCPSLLAPVRLNRVKLPSVCAVPK